MEHIKSSYHLLVAMLIALFLSPAPAAFTERPLLIFAAASLKDALEPVARDFEAETGRKVRLSFAGTSTLARQLQAGAPADIFISADEIWVGFLEKNALIQPETRMIMAKNRLVLAGSPQAGSPQAGGHLTGGRLAGDTGKEIPKILHDFLKTPGTRFAIADPDHVPAGRYAKSALSSLGLYEALRPRFAVSENVRLASLLIARGEVPLGIIYQSDILTNPALKQLGLFDEKSHAPILYPAVLTKKASNGALNLLNFLKSPQAEQHYQKAGLEVAP